jgi:hypothetical protein
MHDQRSHVEGLPFDCRRSYMFAIFPSSAIDFDRFI